MNSVSEAEMFSFLNSGCSFLVSLSSGYVMPRLGTK